MPLSSGISSSEILLFFSRRYYTFHSKRLFRYYTIISLLYLVQRQTYIRYNY